MLSAIQHCSCVECVQAAFGLLLLTGLSYLSNSSMGLTPGWPFLAVQLPVLLLSVALQLLTLQPPLLTYQVPSYFCG
jgi:hypothetical protein